MQDAINELKKAQSQEECLRIVYNILIAKYHGDRIKTITKFFDIFERDINVLWSKNGFLHCTNINYVLKTLLIKSGFFKKEDVRTRWTLIWYFSPHQYIQVRVNNKWINVDVWAHAFGIELGDHAYGFH